MKFVMNELSGIQLEDSLEEDSVEDSGFRGFTVA